MQTKFFTSVILAFLTVIFAWQNPQPITIKFLFISFNISASFVILIIAAIGYFISMGFGVFKEINYKRTIKAKNRSIAKLKKEITKLNNASFGKEIDDNVENSENLEDISSMLLQNEQIQSYIQQNTNLDTPKKEEKNIKKIDFSDIVKPSEIKQTIVTSKLDTMLTGFDDLDEDDIFSLAQDCKSDCVKKLPWYMGNSATKICDINETVPKKEEKDKYKSANIDLKSGYNEFIGIKKEKSKQKLRIKKVSEYKGKKFKKSSITKTKSRKINSEKTFLKKILDSNSLSLDDMMKPNNKKDQKVKSPKNDDDTKKFFLEKEETEINSYECSFLKMHPQQTSPENTLSKNSVKERFNWKSDISQDYVLMQSNNYTDHNESFQGEKISSIKNKLNAIFSNSQKSLNKNYND